MDIFKKTTRTKYSRIFLPFLIWSLFFFNIHISQAFIKSNINFTQLAQTNHYQYTQPIRSLSLSNIILSTTPGGSQISTLYPNEMRHSSVYMRATISDTLSCSRVINGGDVRMFLQQINGNCLLDTCPTASLKTGTCAVTKSCQDGEKDTEVECKVLLPYFATPTDIPGQEDRRWTAIFEAEDTYGLRTREQKNFSISSLKAVTVSGPTEFGSLSLGSVAVSAPISIINSGNTAVSLVRIKVSPMKCKIGAIPPTSFFFSFTPNLPLEQMSPVPSDGIVRSVVNLSKPNALIQSAQKIYWNLKVPKQGLSGTCSGKINYIAE